MVYRKLTQAELVAEARARFGDDPLTWAFVCPRCGDVATPQDFIDMGGDPQRLGQECIGRQARELPIDQSLPGGKERAERGCDWAAYGLFPGPWEIVMPDGHSARGFALAEEPSR